METLKSKREIIERHFADEVFLDALNSIIDSKIESKRSCLGNTSKPILDKMASFMDADGAVKALTELKQQLNSFAKEAEKKGLYNTNQA